MALRSKFRATNVSTIKEKDQEIAESLGRKGKQYTEYLKIEDGENLFRIYPPHPEDMGGGDVFAEPKVVIFLPMLVEEKDDKGNVIMERGRPRLIEKNKSVFNSRIHGGLEKDLVEEYIKLALKNFDEELERVQDPEEQLEIKDKIELIKGNFSKKIQGLKFNQSWVMYVEKIRGTEKKFGLLEIKPAVKNRLNELAVATDTADSPIAMDPFTDPDEGRAIKIIYDSKAKQISDYYKTEIDSAFEKKNINGAIYNMPRLFPLTDERLEEFIKETPLAQKFRNVFTQRDFQLQITGLEYFDNKHKLGIFNSPEFIEILEEISVTVPEDKESTENLDKVSSHQYDEDDYAPIDVGERVNEDFESKDEFDLMTRKELHQWHRDNQTGIQIVPTMSDDQIREYARNFVQDMEMADVSEDEEEQNVPESEEAKQEVVQEKVEEQKMSARERIAAMKKKLSK